MNHLTVIGKRLPRVDAMEMVTGRANYADDIFLPKMLIGKILRSPYPHARLLHISTGRAEKLPGVKAVMTAEDAPQVKSGMHPDLADEPPLATEKVRYIGEPVAAVAAVDELTALEALDLIEVVYEELPAVFDPIEAMKPGAPAIHETIGFPEARKVVNNVAHTTRLDYGHVEKGFAKAAHIFENSFSTQPVAHCCLDTHASIADWEPSGKVTVWTPCSMPHGLRTYMSNYLEIPFGKLRVINPFVGGNFGSKQEMLACNTCSVILSRMSGRPVKIIYDREEEFTSTRIRHPIIFELKTGLTQDGFILAKQAKVIVENGAYTSQGPGILANCCASISFLYRVPNLKFEGYLVYTNNPYGGAFRAYGNPQVTFAVESELDIIAEELGIDPIELRMKNAREANEVTATGMMITSCAFKECLAKAAELSKWRQKRHDPEWKGAGDRTIRRGIGVASGYHSTGYRAHHENDSSSAFVKLNVDGSVTLLTGDSDVGQGAKTVLAQIAAEELGVKLDDIEVVSADTSTTPPSLGSFASRVTFIGGNAVRIAAQDAKRQLLEAASERLEVSPNDLEVEGGKIYVKGSRSKCIPFREVVYDSFYSQKSITILGRGYYDPPHTKLFNLKTGQGNWSPAYSFAVNIAEVEVDEQTGQVKALNFTVAQDLGRAINPMGSEGQIEGGVAMGSGFALTEELVWEEGRIFNPNLVHYGFPTSMDTPWVRALLIESIDPYGPFGAKGGGEVAIVPSAPALANAIYNAVGVRIKALPATPGKLLEALGSKYVLHKVEMK